jgi:uncharacterized DUF497 family protein
LIFNTKKYYILIMETRHIVWDPSKGIENKAKHHVSFDTAQFVFADPFRIERRDDSKGNFSGEERWQTLGKVDRVYFVAYTERVIGTDEQTRLIMARLASKAERRSYHGTDRKNDKGWTKTD